MRKSKLALSLAAALGASYAYAAPIVLPAAPLYIQFNNAEQFSLTNTIPGQTGNVSTRGIVQINTINQGTVLPPTGSDIQGGGLNIFTDSGAATPHAQILGLFQIGPISLRSPANTGTQSNGPSFLDLYWFDASAQNVGTQLASGVNGSTPAANFNANSTTYTGFTCTTAEANTPGCTFLARFNFVPGSDPSYPNVSTTTPQIPGTVNGNAQSYLSVDTTHVGAWTAQLNTNFFTLDPCNNPVNHVYVANEVCSPTGLPLQGPGGISFPGAPDLRLDNTYTTNGANAWDVAGLGWQGLRSNDPGRTFAQAVPEPTFIALMGLALAGLGAMRRRRSEKN